MKDRFAEKYCGKEFGLMWTNPFDTLNAVIYIGN